MHDGTTQTDVTPAGWQADDLETTVWSSCVLNGIGYINASDRDPVFWAGDPLVVCQPLPDWPTDGRCVTLRAHKSFLFGIGFLSDGPQRVRWSDAAETGTVPQYWTPAADNFAGFIDLAPLSSPCIDGSTLRDSFVVFKQESMWSLDFVGGNTVFAARKMFAEHGVAGANAITRGIDDVLLFVGDDGDIYLTDGVRVSSVLDGRAQRTFYGDFSANQNRIFSAATLAREKTGFIIYPSANATAGDRALVLDFSSNDISFRQMPDVLCAAEGGALSPPGDENSWEFDTQAWEDDRTQWSQQSYTQTLDDLMVGGGGGFALVSDPTAQDFLSGPVVASLVKSGLGFGEPQARKMVTRIWPKVSGAAGDTIEFRVGGQENTGGPISLGPSVQYTIGQDGPIDTMVQGRFLSLNVSSNGGSLWRLGSIDVEYRVVGGW